MSDGWHDVRARIDLDFADLRRAYPIPVMLKVCSVDVQCLKVANRIERGVDWAQAARDALLDAHTVPDGPWNPILAMICALAPPDSSASPFTRSIARVVRERVDSGFLSRTVTAVIHLEFSAPAFVDAEALDGTVELFGGQTFTAVMNFKHAGGGVYTTDDPRPNAIKSLALRDAMKRLNREMSSDGIHVNFVLFDPLEFLALAERV